MAPNHPGFAFSTHTSGGDAIVTLRGDLDIAHAPSVRELLRDLLSATGARRVILDLSGVESCDANGLAVLVGGYRRARRRGIVLVLAGPRPGVAHVLRTSGLSHVFQVFGTAAAAAERQPA